jgi:hypothetical protein
MGHYAHFELPKTRNLEDLYTRHAEVARDIHQDVLRQLTGNNELVVDLVPLSPVEPSEELFQKLSEYDVVSASTGVGPGQLFENVGLHNRDNIELSRKMFEEMDLPIIVSAAGNDAEKKIELNKHLVDFSRTGITVGESNVKDGFNYIEKHSSHHNPTMASSNLFNEGKKYQYINPNPSLEGHEGIIQKWLVDKEFVKRFTEFEDSAEGKLTDDEVRSAVRNIKSEMRSERYAQSLKSEIDGYIKNPQDFHDMILDEIQKKMDVDDNGYTSDVNGTSFSSPTLAGHVSATLYQQEQREMQNLPVLTKEEVSTLARMATMDTSVREGQTELMSTYNNASGFEFSEMGGHGVFNPEMFNKLLDKAYDTIENNPDIDRTPITVTMKAEASEVNGSKRVTLHSDLEEGSDPIVIERSRLDINYQIQGSVPDRISVSKPGEDPISSRIRQASGRVAIGDDSVLQETGWVRMETDFGNRLSAGDSWSFRMIQGQDTEILDSRITVYGYSDGGLMSQMIDYSQQISTTPKLVSPAVQIEQGLDNNAIPEFAR